MLNNIIFKEYFNLLLFMIILFFISASILFFSYILVKRYNNMEKILPYECGFSPMEDSRKKFNINFYIVGILFIIFDLEISFLFPWVLNATNNLSLFLMLFFLLILTLGFIYEWKKGALNWK